ncbi:MAG: hypothetical protein QM770_20310 [Tepidisphaeraceae bacterium]
MSIALVITGNSTFRRPLTDDLVAAIEAVRTSSIRAAVEVLFGAMTWEMGDAREVARATLIKAVAELASYKWPRRKAFHVETPDFDQKVFGDKAARMKTSARGYSGSKLDGEYVYFECVDEYWQVTTLSELRRAQEANRFNVGEARNRANS